MKTAEVEIGRLIAKTVNRDISLLECSSLVQEQLDLIKLDAERSGYERGVTANPDKRQEMSHLALSTAIARYAKHRYECPMSQVGLTEANQCQCGLSTLLKQLE